jgi:serine/threonine protein kinase
MLDENFQLKLVDFGLSLIQEDQCGSLLHGAVGSVPYSAPEVYYNKELYRSHGYRGEPADVWSCGVTLFIMLTGKAPFKRPLHKNFAPNLRKCTQFTNLLDGNYPSDISPLAKDLLRKLFQLNPGHRLALEEILMHPWCKGEIPSDERIIERMTDCARNSWKIQGKWWLNDKLLANRFNWSISIKNTFISNESEHKHVESMVSDLGDHFVQS